MLRLIEERARKYEADRAVSRVALCIIVRKYAQAGGSTCTFAAASDLCATHSRYVCVAKCFVSLQAKEELGRGRRSRGVSMNYAEGGDDGLNELLGDDSPGGHCLVWIGWGLGGIAEGGDDGLNEVVGGITAFHWLACTAPVGGSAQGGACPAHQRAL